MSVSSELYALLQVVLIDLTLAGDNAIVVGMIAASLPRETRKQVILIGVIFATLFRVAFSFVAVQLLHIIGLMLAGGILLLWVAWKLFREIRLEVRRRSDDIPLHPHLNTSEQSKSFTAAVWQIVIADISMSLDNVLAVAGAARHHVWVLVGGLALSVAFMAFAATFIATLLKRYYWITYVGLAVILYVAGAMIWEGSNQVIESVN